MRQVKGPEATQGGYLARREKSYKECTGESGAII